MRRIFNDFPKNQPTNITLDCTILHHELHLLLPGLHKIGWTAWLEYALGPG